ncbi:hypothetical protein DS885_03800 [Psychromonas sp. B3M02]|uniref:DUF2859 domain-containing protein n=1 Tax=Psychromonas sp. B3M02 TaxID=2267226 RepID=UPI000DEA6253|nr:DUF2859 domain-containing protein [Psychromonas sp. B3M02]RBW47280.1 hypothetical protein DS885_03800 [Psychromonas sp. B3M02]
MKNIIFFLFSLISFQSLSNTTVLYDTGKATNIKNPFKVDSSSNIRVANSDPIEVLSSQFPIISDQWELATFSSKAINFPDMVSPIFIVGCDPQSLDWVNFRKPLIEDKKALGFVVNCPSYDDYYTFKSAIYPIVVQAASLNKLTEILSHNKYPAYIHSRAIEQ